MSIFSPKARLPLIQFAELQVATCVINDARCSFQFRIIRTLLSLDLSSLDLRGSVLWAAVLIYEGICTGTLWLWILSGSQSVEAVISLPLGLSLFDFLDYLVVGSGTCCSGTKDSNVHISAYGMTIYVSKEFQILLPIMDELSA